MAGPEIGTGGGGSPLEPKTDQTNKGLQLQIVRFERERSFTQSDLQANAAIHTANEPET